MSQPCFQVNTVSLIVSPNKKELVLTPLVNKELKLAPNASVTINQSGTDILSRSVTLGEPLVSYTLVVLIDGLVYAADTTNLLHIGYVEGIILGGGGAGTSVLCVTDGQIDNPAWSWNTTDGSRLYASTNGALAQTPNFTHEFTQEVGTINTATEITLDVQSPIKQS